MLSFEQFLIEGLLATRVKDKKFLHPARQALKMLGFFLIMPNLISLTLTKQRDLNLMIF